MRLVKELRSDTSIEKDYKGREMSQNYITIYVELNKNTKIIILKQQLIDDKGKELENYNCPRTGVSSARGDKLVFRYKLPNDNYILKENSSFYFAYKLINTNEEISERFVFKNDNWEREM